jgi:uncharacterized surface protein with fasciclin (FAS1) repeats
MRHGAVLAACLALAACGGGGGESGNNQAQPEDNNAVAGANAKGLKNGGASAKATLLDTLGGSADHATLANAVKAAGLEKTLAGGQAYTLFAPTEAAFQKLPAGTMSGLLAPDRKGHLTALLTGHIVSGTVTADDLSRAVERGKGKAQLATVGGSTLSFARQGDALVLADAEGAQVRVVGADRAASNGVIHAIDAVLMPPQ